MMRKTARAGTLGALGTLPHPHFAPHLSPPGLWFLPLTLSSSPSTFGIKGTLQGLRRCVPACAKLHFLLGSAAGSVYYAVCRYCVFAVDHKFEEQQTPPQHGASFLYLQPLLLHSDHFAYCVLTQQIAPPTNCILSVSVACCVT